MESAMDFHCLSRRELQALCKKNKIPANVTNAAMADALQNLQHVEGLEEIKTPSEISPEKLTSAMKSVPRTATRRKPIILDPETPAAVPSTRRKAPAVAASALPKAESVAYSTRRSVRLAEKQLSQLCLNDNKGNKIQGDFWKELNESADCVSVSKTVSESYTKEVSDACSETTNDSEAVSALNQMEVSSVMSEEKEMVEEVKINEGVDVQSTLEVECVDSDDSGEISPVENLPVPSVIVIDEDLRSENENEEKVSKIEENYSRENLQVPIVVVADEMDIMSENVEKVSEIEENNPVENLQVTNVIVTDEMDVMSEIEDEKKVSKIEENLLTMENSSASVMKIESLIPVMSNEELKGEIPFSNWAVDPQLGHIPRPAQVAPLKSSILPTNDLVMMSDNEELNKENAEKLKVKKMDVSDVKASTPLENKSLRQIRKMLKSKLDIKSDLKNKAVQESEHSRTALQVLPENVE